MYAKVFQQIYDGSLCTDGSWQALVTFQQMLVLADEHGVVDMTAEAISRRTTIPIDIIKQGLSELVKPDPRSRTPDEDGRRLLPLSPSRDWGWVVVNYRKYRQIQREVDRREYHREYWHKRKAKATSAEQSDSKPDEQLNTLNSTQPTQPNQPIAYTEAEAKEVLTNIDQRVFAGNRADSPGAVQLDCPHFAILDAWKHALPELTQHDPDLWAGTRADHLRARWRERAASKGWQTQQEGLEYFRRLFAWIRDSDWLMGRVGGGDGRAFKLTLEWLVAPTNWAKVLEGKYHGSTTVSGPVTAKDRERKALADKWMGEFAQKPQPVTIDADATPQQNLMLGG